MCDSILCHAAVFRAFADSDGKDLLRQNWTFWENRLKVGSTTRNEPFSKSKLIMPFTFFFLSIYSKKESFLASVINRYLPF